VLILILASVNFYTYLNLGYEQKKNIKNLKIDSERKYLELADLLPQVVFECDFDGNIKFLNSVGKDNLGLTRIDLQKGINIKSIIYSNDRERFVDDFFYIREGGLNKGQLYNVVGAKGINVPMVFYMSHVNSNNNITGIRGIAIDITEQKVLERKILSAVIETEDHERQRFSEDLHDGLGPLLSTIKLYVNQLKVSKLNEQDKNLLLDSTFELLDEAIVTTRAIANNILPGTISDNGLIPAVNSFCYKIQSTGSISIDLDSNISDRLNPNIEKTFYRIVIELINNTLKHAQASKIKISIQKIENELIMTYSDNGIGFDTNHIIRGLGLENIRNRCKSIDANLQFITSPNKGFTMEIKTSVTS